MSPVIAISIVLPAYAGVILKYYVFVELHESLTRVCGGDPNAKTVRITNDKSYPRMRG